MAQWFKKKKKDKIVKSYNATCTMTTGNEHNSIIKVPSSSNFIITFNFEIVKLHTFSSDGRFLERRLIVSSYVSSLADFPYPGFCVYLGITSIRSWEKNKCYQYLYPKWSDGFFWELHDNDSLIYLPNVSRAGGPIT